MSVLRKLLGCAAATALLIAPFAVGTAAAATGSCDRHVSERTVDSAQPGEVLCVDSVAKTKRLKITKGGTPDKPVVYEGKGQEVGGIDITANNVVVDGFTLNQPSAPGIAVYGDNITVQNNTVTAPKGGDGDGLRFFGNDITIRNNVISRTDNSTGAHADCMQTFATDDKNVASQRVVIDGNRCEQVDNMCLMAEGPHSSAGDGSGKGVSENWTFSNNFCQTRRAAQALMVDDVQHLTVTGNTWAAGPNHAIGLQNHSTDAHVQDNKLDPSIKCEVGIDKSSKKGYQGPTPRCDP